MKVFQLFCVVFLLNFYYSNSQSIANYATTRTTGNSYVSIASTGSAFDSWRNTTTLTQDDNRSDLTDIGFDFWYNGTRYTQFSVSTNGYIDFSSSTADGGPIANAYGYDNALFTGNGSGTWLAIAPFYDDLTAQGGTSALGNSIKYQVSGTAPNRVLTVEWINMAVYGNTAPSLNFQVKLYETTGVIEINYGTMNNGGVTFSYTTGINADILSNTPTAAQLKTLQTANTNTFSNTQQNGLSVMPASGSRYTFTPPTPTAVSGSLTFSGVTQTGMTLNWPNWATNEVGYVIYNSTDNSNFSFISQTAANTTTSAISGLLPGTTYYWRVCAVTEGALSTALTGTRATNAAGNKISVTTGNWNTAGTWSPSGVPTASDNVTISNGHTVTINGNAVCNNLTVGAGSSATLSIGNNNTARSLSPSGTITVNTNATLNVNTGSNTTHTLYVNDNIINNGTINLNTDGNSNCTAVFQKNGNITISGTGATNSFYLMTLNMGSSVNNIVEFTTPSFSAPADFLTLTAGTLKISTSGASTITPFSTAVAIPQKGGIWLNSSASTINFGATVTIYGNLTNSNGTTNVGNAADEDLLSNGGILSVSGGTMNIAGKYYAIGINNLSKFNITGGTVTVPAYGSTNTTIAPFQIAGTGSQFTMTGGTLIIPREGGTGAQDLGFVNTGATGGTVTGGTLQIGSTSTPAGQTMQINTSFSIGNLLVNSTNATAKLLTNNLSVIGNITINSGTFNANNLNATLGGNWVNNGGTFTPGTGMVTFSSTGAQSIFKSGGETFNDIVFDGSGTKTLASAVTANGNFTINSGSVFDISASNYQVTIKKNYSNSGTFTARSGNVLLNGTTAQTIGGTSTTNFYNLTLSNTSGASLLQNENIIGSLFLNNGTFNVNSKNFTLISTATGSGRIAEITGSGDISGNVIVQRYAPGGYTGWAFLGAPVTSALTYADWDDDIPISCNSCPDGSAAGFLSIYTYNESVGGAYDNAAAYVPITSINNPVTNGKGYWVYLGDGYTTTNNITLDVTGTVRKFNYTLPLSYTNTGSAPDDGWNLISNPYPSPIRWSLLRGTTTGIDNGIYIYNADLNGGTGGYATYVNGISSPAVSAGGIGDTIPICQGFYVHSTGATSLGAKEANKVGGNPTFLRQTNPYNEVNTVSNPLIRLFLDKSTGNFHDETVLYLQSGATNGFDVDYDAYKLGGGDANAPTIALEFGGKEYQVNGVAPITSNFSMPLKARTGYNGQYTISAQGVSSFPQGTCITLYDNLTGITTDLTSSSYTFNLNSSTTTARFSVNITLDPLQINSTTTDPSCSLPNAGKIVAVGANSGPWNYYWTDNNGTVLQTHLNKNTPDTLSNIPGGDYIVSVNTVGMCDNNTTQFSLNVIEIPQAQFTSVDTVYLSNGGTIDFTNSSLNTSFSSWDFGDGNSTNGTVSPQYMYTAAGVYTVYLFTESSTGCVDTSMKNIVVIDNTVGLESLLLHGGIVVKTLSESKYQVLERYDEKKQVVAILMDGGGKLVRDYGKQQTSELRLDVDLSLQESGIYYLQLMSESNSQTIRLIKN